VARLTSSFRSMKKTSWSRKTSGGSTWRPLESQPYDHGVVDKPVAPVKPRTTWDKFLDLWLFLNDTLIFSLPVLPEVFQTRVIVNGTKLAVGLIVAALIYVKNAWDDPSAMLLLAMQGTYSVCWCVKDQSFPDANWDRPTSLASALYIFMTLGVMYSSMGFVAIYWLPRRNLPAYVMCMAISMWGLGILLHFAADSQKYWTLKMQTERSLIKTGLFAYSRNTNCTCCSTDCAARPAPMRLWRLLPACAPPSREGALKWAVTVTSAAHTQLSCFPTLSLCFVFVMCARLGRNLDLRFLLRRLPALDTMGLLRLCVA